MIISSSIPHHIFLRKIADYIFLKSLLSADISGYNGIIKLATHHTHTLPPTFSRLQNISNALGVKSSLSSYNIMGRHKCQM